MAISPYKTTGGRFMNHPYGAGKIPLLNAVEVSLSPKGEMIPLLHQMLQPPIATSSMVTLDSGWSLYWAERMCRNDTDEGGTYKRTGADASTRQTIRERLLRPDEIGACNDDEA